jgi:hypothetical protein
MKMANKLVKLSSEQRESLTNLLDRELEKYSKVEQNLAVKITLNHLRSIRKAITVASLAPKEKIQTTNYPTDLPKNWGSHN